MIPSYGDVRVVMVCTKIFTVVSQISAYRVHRFHIWANNVHCPVPIGTYGWLAYMNKEAFSTTFMLTSSNGNIFRVTGPLWREFTWHRRIPLPKPVTRGFDVFFDLHLKKRLSKQSRRRWFETPSHSLWRHCYVSYVCLIVSTIIHYFGNSCHWSMTVVTTTALLAGVIFQISRKRKSAHYEITYWVYRNTWWRHQMETWSRNWFCEGDLQATATGQWRGALMFSLVCAWTNDWADNRDAGDLRRHSAHCDAIVMQFTALLKIAKKRKYIILHIGEHQIHFHLFAI